MRTASGIALLAALISLFSLAVAGVREDAVQEAARFQAEAQTLLSGGRYLEAVAVASRALTLRERTLGAEHPDVAVTLHTLGQLNAALGNHETARASFLRALAIREKVLGSEHQDTGALLVSLANLYVSMGDFTRGEPIYLRAQAILTKALGPDHIETARALFGLGNLYEETAAYDRAESLYQRVLAIRERGTGARSAATANVLNRLGNLYRSMGAYARARPLYERALAIREAALGPEHPEVSGSLVNLAVLYDVTGDYIDAEALYKRALAIQERALGTENPAIARLLSNLANHYMDTGAYADAEPLLRRALAIQRKARGESAEGVARSLISLARMYSVTGRAEQAKPLLQQALAVAEQGLGSKHPLTGLVTGNLGDTYRELGAYDQAKPLLNRAVALTEAAQGLEHPDTADAIGILASLHSDSGEYRSAQPLLRRALAIYEKTLSPDHPNAARALRSLAVTHWALGESQQALSLLSRAQRIEIKNSQRLLLAGSEARKRDYLETLADNTFVDVSLGMSTSGTSATELALTSVLYYKGRVLDAVSDSLARIRGSIAAGDRALLDQLADTTSQLSTLTYGSGADLSPEQYRARLTQLVARQEQLEGDLARRSREFSREVTPVTFAGIRRAIPVNAVLLEWFRYTPYEPTAKSVATPRGAARYVVFVLKRDGQLHAVDVGEAQSVDTLVRHLRGALSTPSSKDVMQYAAALSRQLLAPLRSHLQGVEQILFSPDGDLNLVPMAVLLDESGRYLVERVDVSYLTSARDLLRIAAHTPRTGGGVVVVANPDYGIAKAAPQTTPSIRRQRSADLDRSGLLFRALPDTAREARDLKALLNLDDTAVLLRADASEARLKRLASPRILHIASHGFFLSDQQLTRDRSGRLRSNAVTRVRVENPLLRAGLALAGANERSSGDEDGILTALEVTQLDLRETELVVLSACDSGVGQVQSGEGVYGLRRALALAGAQAQLTSLWKVSDEATRNLMIEYYQRLLQGEGRATALRRTQRQMLAGDKYAHPYYWASFIPIGSWYPLPKLGARDSPRAPLRGQTQGVGSPAAAELEALADR